MCHHLAILSPKPNQTSKRALLGYIEAVMKEKAEMPKTVISLEGTYIKIFAPTNA